MDIKDQIIQLVEEEDVEFIRLQFSDVFGNLKNIAITTGQVEKCLRNQCSFAGSAMYDDLLHLDEELYLHPDPNSFAILPWRPQQGKVGRLMCDVCYEDGTPFENSPRWILKKVLKKAHDAGYQFFVDPECEFFLFHTDDNGNATTISHERAGYLDVGPVDFGENARREIVLTLEEMGFEIQSSHHEKAPGQHEIDFAGDEALNTADALMSFKFAVRAIAKRFGLFATFMPKPRTDAPGSGMHLNFSVLKDGDSIFSTDDKGDANEYAKYFMAGILEHAEGMCAITNPIVNSYKRILPQFGAAGSFKWSTKRGHNIIKLRKSMNDTRVEVRFPDPSADPYLSIAVCIAAGLDGLERKLEPESLERMSSRHLPGNLKDAIRSLKRDKYLCELLGEDFTQAYIALKKQEWNDYMLQVSDWEINRYLGKM